MAAAAGPEYFEELYAGHGALRAALVSTNLACELLMCLAMRSMVAVERGSPGNRRTILARMVSCLCAYNVAMTALFRLPLYAMLLTGNWPEDACYALIVAQQITLSCVMNMFGLIAILKSLFLFVFKNVWALLVGEIVWF